MNKRRLPNLLTHGQFVQRAATPTQVLLVTRRPIRGQQGLGRPENAQIVLLVHVVSRELFAHVIACIPSPFAVQGREGTRAPIWMG